MHYQLSSIEVFLFQAARDETRVFERHQQFYAFAPFFAAANWKRAACRRRTITLHILLNSSWLSVRSSSRC